MVTIVGKNEAVKKRATCRNCGTIHEYMESEVRTLWEGTDISGGPDGARGFKCQGEGCPKDVIVERW